MDPKAQILLNAFFKKFALKTFRKENLIITRGDKKIFFLTKGIVRMFDASGKKGLTLNIYRADALFPMALVFDLKNRYSFESLTEVQGYFALKKDF